jgi:colanic acid/amylovoran biosynthesis glycosyltransferase
MPRLLVLAGEFPVASETFVVGHVQGMISRGWEVAVCAYSIHPDALARAFSTPPKTFALEPRANHYRNRSRLTRWWTMRGLFGPEYASLFPETAGKNLPSRAAAFLEIAREWRPDAIHAHFGPLGLVASPAAKLLDIPLLINFRGYDFLNYAPGTRWKDYTCFPENAIAVGHTAFCEDILREHLKVRVEHVRRGVNRERFKPPQRGDTWCETVKLLVVGRLLFNKGHHLAVDALALLRRLKPATRFELTLAGGGDMHDTLVARAETLGVRGQVRLTGALNHDAVGEEMRNADILLIPSLPRASGWVENFCTVASEGLASGLAVVAVNNGGVPEAVQGAGVLVPAGSALELARGIVHAMEQHTPARWSEIALRKAGEYQESWMLDDYERVTNQATEQKNA